MDGSHITLTVAVHANDECAAPVAAMIMSSERAIALADVFRAIADPTRVRLIDYLAAVPGGTVCACHLPAHLGISQPTLSHHLKKLVDGGIITREQRGRWAHYTVVPESLAVLSEFLKAATAPDEG